MSATHADNPRQVCMRWNARQQDAGFFAPFGDYVTHYSGDRPVRVRSTEPKISVKKSSIDIWCCQVQQLIQRHDGKTITNTTDVHTIPSIQTPHTCMYIQVFFLLMTLITEKQREDARDWGGGGGKGRQKANKNKNKNTSRQICA